MKTTEVFVEQVLIGLVVLAAAAALAHPPLLDHILRANLGSLALLGGAAYLAGVVYDRLADTLLEDLERHSRLAFALSELRRRNPLRADDPFPEGLYRIALFGSGEASDYAHYLRTRIRLTRSLGTLMPALAAAAAALPLQQDDRPLRISLAVLVAVAYLLALAMKLAPRQPLPTTAAEEPKGRFARWFPLYRWPRTHELLDSSTRESYRELIDYDDGNTRPKAGWFWFAMRHETSLQILIGFTAAAVVLLMVAGWPLLVFLPLAGLVLTLLICWSWLRIAGTFMAFLRDFHRYRPAAGQGGGGGR